MAAHILLLRRSTDSDAHEQHDAYVREFSAHFKQVHCVAPLTDEFVAESTLACIIQETPEQASHWGVVVTSKRAVEAFSHALHRLEHGEALARWWRTVVWFAVGPGTAAALRQALAIEALGAEAGEAVALSRVIIDQWTAIKEAAATTTTTTAATLLFLSGEQRRDTLPRQLNAAQCPFREVSVYRVRECPELAEELSAACAAMRREQHAAHWLAFFSPSGVHFALPHLNGMDLSPTRPPASRQAGSDDEAAAMTWRVAAIGATTAGALEAAGIRVDAVADIPSAQGLREAIQRCLGN
ncbi:tetrapyrrole biosynthesis, uroporphyrinogen III synthase [Syncephalis pseudoplumigaleata]|uniref:Tetrapyrrole biosynthesis, uroporphyrinogen III synthase n=1 Tax=Syncephalis pseudoplumigaleata TaxID=1712513 RepID=A0A4P9YW27_9FUNG|nr:tetrapyrrole biosynthesis, uroporphyrinogen III synthase [Syncephalis pseudoplumigaleata]|eukprot:RKP24217.1 tetrapyrrole biosynthesis, uroporphyrinogen III synthase [Syncephalis pseudoplumigaleata]